ncbi:izumo sperm-egg fusion protein 1 isoform X2 [Syngnathoides biaculeatus]|uniref:izumo sperm-egg fusion protein 1 isoform X2 n=1 Tax=Syngnathoides biaculeatus TaxID=300417 RepID=UPI002ADDF8A7|nr:izumo sperm-egg fusion protein 1 isoform X2 [Syngnathoides biaculeatus]
MNDGDRMLGKHLDKFIGERLCPNQCGLLKRRVMDCTSCKYRMYSCPSPSGKVDCGEHPMRAEEGGQAVLDCFRPWHSLLLGSPEYHYTWAPAVSGDAKLNESDFRNVVVMEDSSLVLNQLHVSDQGVYRCSLEGQDGAVFYRVAFPLTVTPGPTRRPRASVKRPAPAPEDDGSLFQSSGGALATLMAVVSALSLAGSLVFVAVIEGDDSAKKHITEGEQKGGGRKQRVHLFLTDAVHSKRFLRGAENFQRTRRQEWKSILFQQLRNHQTTNLHPVKLRQRPAVSNVTFWLRWPQFISTGRDQRCWLTS